MNDDKKAKGKKILVVDDILYVAKFVAKVLQVEGYTVLTAFSGKEALAKVELFKPDLITIDHLLPDMTGFDLVRQLPKLMDGENRKIIYISAVYERTTVESALKLGVDNYLIKPVEIDRLLQTVSNLLH